MGWWLKLRNIHPLQNIPPASMKFRIWATKMNFYVSAENIKVMSNSNIQKFLNLSHLFVYEPFMQMFQWCCWLHIIFTVTVTQMTACVKMSKATLIQQLIKMTTPLTGMYFINSIAACRLTNTFFFYCCKRCSLLGCNCSLPWCTLVFKVPIYTQSQTI